jgi:hypothetical protein
MSGFKKYDKNFLVYNTQKIFYKSYQKSHWPSPQASSVQKSLLRLVSKKFSTFLFKLKALKPKSLPFDTIKSLQQMCLLLQKKLFTNKLWGYYRLKSLNCPSDSIVNLSSIFSPNIDSHYSPTKSFYSDYSICVYDPYFSGAGKIYKSLNRVIQKKILKNFWIVYFFDWEDKKLRVSTQASRFVGVINKILNKYNIHLKSDVIRLIKHKFPSKKQFLSYIIAPVSEKAAKIIINFINHKEKLLLSFSFKTLSKPLYTKKKAPGINKFFSFSEFKLRSLKKESFLIIKNYSKYFYKDKKISFFVHQLYFLIKIRLTYGFYQIKCCSEGKMYWINSIIQFFFKKYKSSMSFGLESIKKRAKDSKYWKKTERKTRKPSNKLILLPTIFLKGDPGDTMEIKYNPRPKESNQKHFIKY